MSRQLTAVVFVLATACAGAVGMYWPTPRRQALERVWELNGTYTRTWEPAARRWVAAVSFADRPVTDADLAVLRSIRPLHRVSLDGTRVTDAGLAHLEGVEGLEWVSACRTGVSDEGMVHFRRVPGLRQLHLCQTRVTDAGLLSVHGLPNLHLIDVADTRVTAAGLAALCRATPSLKDVRRAESD
jgi:hypothetical protein